MLKDPLQKRGNICGDLQPRNVMEYVFSVVIIVCIFLALFLVRAAILDIESNGKRNISKMVLVKNDCCQGRLRSDQVWSW